jgi:hypothetical protein
VIFHPGCIVDFVQGALSRARWMAESIFRVGWNSERPLRKKRALYDVIGQMSDEELQRLCAIASISSDPEDGSTDDIPRLRPEEAARMLRIMAEGMKTGAEQDFDEEVSEDEDAEEEEPLKVLPVGTFEQRLHRAKRATEGDSRKACCFRAGEEFLRQSTTFMPVACWGIFNPFGPTVYTLALASEAADGDYLLVAVIANPFAGIERSICGWQPAPIQADALKTALINLVRQHRDDPASPFAGAPPSYLVCQPSFALPIAALKDVFREVLRSCENADLAQDCRSIRQHWCKPWDRTGAAVQAAADDLMKNNNLKTKAAPGKRSFEEKDFEDWWQLVTHPAHAVAELKEMPAAWVGSIEAVGNNLFEVVDVEEGLAFHWRFIHPCKQQGQR